MRYLTAGESHGRGLFAIIDGFPAGLDVDQALIDQQLARRQGGYGRGGRQKIEKDRVEFLSGLRWGTTLGSPLTLAVWNLDNSNWKQRMSSDPADRGADDPVTRPRPGHADLSGALKRDFEDVRNVLERSSARETAIRVAIGALSQQLLASAGVRVQSYVRSIGDLQGPILEDSQQIPEQLGQSADSSICRFLHAGSDDELREYIDRTRLAGDTLGGIFEVIVTGLPPGIGDYASYDAKLDGRLGQALMGMQAIKGVEVGMGFDAARQPGSRVHDAIEPGEPWYSRSSNRAGGLEGGMTNGQPLVVRVAKKPIPTLGKPLGSVDIRTGQPFEAAYERSDVTAVPAASIIGEAIVSTVIAQSMLEQFGNDCMQQFQSNLATYIERAQAFCHPGRQA